MTDILEIREGRHPVIERACRPVSSSPMISWNQSTEILIITGPNMAGKSTIMRQTALIVIMAQMGSFVPADEARIGIVDRIFTRVGATDDLIRGQHVYGGDEETANILSNATPRSLSSSMKSGAGHRPLTGCRLPGQSPNSFMTFVRCARDLVCHPLPRADRTRPHQGKNQELSRGGEGME